MLRGGGGGVLRSVWEGGVPRNTGGLDKKSGVCPNAQPIVPAWRRAANTYSMKEVAYNHADDFCPGFDAVEGKGAEAPS